LRASLRTHPIHSSAYHPQTDGQAERVNQVLEDMPKVCVMDQQGSWDQCLSLAEFLYKNSYKESIKMASFEALYDHCCRNPLNWIESGRDGNLWPRPHHHVNAYWLIQFTPRQLDLSLHMRNTSSSFVYISI
jgi:hypothetical protein